jgi:peptidoglycan/xylan/chitin deacetylase (PgdA/CDA1 family)
VQATPTATPTPKPLTFSEMNTLYGPCVYLPTLMYHHVQIPEAAKKKNQVALTVRTADFIAQMQYLKDKAYNVISMQDLLNFFEQGVKPSPKSVLLTFDDGYDDFYTDAYPILREFNYPATVFIPTGLMNNTGYLTWDKISEMAGNRILFANHTWSHKNVKTKEDVLKMEIPTADVQLNEKGLNTPKVFAYPYGLEGSSAISFLQGLDYKLAFTTRSGGTLCKKQMLNLPRVRIGNGSLSIYGL